MVGRSAHDVHLVMLDAAHRTVARSSTRRFPAGCEGLADGVGGGDHRVPVSCGRARSSAVSGKHRGEVRLQVDLRSDRRFIVAHRFDEGLNKGFDVDDEMLSVAIDAPHRRLGRRPPVDDRDAIVLDGS